MINPALRASIPDDWKPCINAFGDDMLKQWSRDTNSLVGIYKTVKVFTVIEFWHK